MKNSHPIAIIGGYDAISSSFFAKTKLLNQNSIFINVNSKKTNKKGIYNFEIFELGRIINTLQTYKINNLLFLGKVTRPNLSKYKNDGEIEKYIPQLINSFKKGDGTILSQVINIFKQKGFNIISPLKISPSFFLEKNDLSEDIPSKIKVDIDKSIKLLDDLSKYDNAQSLVMVNGYIIAIEAAEGTDSMLIRAANIRKKLNQSEHKAGILTKIPKKNQSKFIDLPVIGVRNIKLAKKVSLSGIAINPSFTIVHNKNKILKLAKENGLKIYNVNG